MVQTLNTSRLLLRELRPTDAALLFSEYTSDHDVARYLPWRVHTSVAETHEMIAAADELAKEEEAQLYAIALREAPDAAIGLANLSSIGQGPSLGLGLSRAYWGHGYGHEAVAAFAGYIFKENDAPHLSAYCDIENRTSVRMLEKAGFKYQRTERAFAIHPQISAKPRDCLIFALTRPSDD